MNIGFTGTRYGMTQAQVDGVREFFTSHDNFIFHHGDCVGADAEAHDLARQFQSFIIIHPPVDSTLRAGKSGDADRPAMSHFVRNRVIVVECQFLLAAPREPTHQPRGGTWYTIDYAKKSGRRGKILFPDGTEENFND